ncbi:hypothetical protein F9C07_1719353 [Aspergillus flavus]|uniref:Uncharacterized protein n=1 Tax=Aspergillus flavus (strain ATCC 200026 / FGSC A1120 / IAM 13836 / NRRL 3357 / JCM 12722 / SRRC 167) TaxID=332952 RepID=A0A7U2MJN2_ASPFN|nr:hypothetical protein F9C07_1719353 [Aspergillus flavus]
MPRGTYIVLFIFFFFFSKKKRKEKKNREWDEYARQATLTTNIRRTRKRQNIFKNISITDLLLSVPIHNLYFLYHVFFLLSIYSPDPPPNPTIRIFNYTPIFFV